MAIGGVIGPVAWPWPAGGRGVGLNPRAVWGRVWVAFRACGINTAGQQPYMYTLRRESSGLGQWNGKKVRAQMAVVGEVWVRCYKNEKATNGISPCRASPPMRGTSY
jgi:hypothetical protein